MSIFGDFAGATFGLKDLKVAARNADGSYGPAVDVPSAQMYEVNPQTVNAQLEGDDQITATHAVATGAQVRFRFGSVPFELLAILTGKTISDYGSESTADRVELLRLDALRFPYFGIVGKVESVEDEGSMHVFVPMLKVMEGFTVGFQYGQFTIPEITCQAIPDSVHGIVELIKYEEANVAVTIPPVYGE